jgi:nitrate reductase cytochrome c-type subunit
MLDVPVLDVPVLDALPEGRRIGSRRRARCAAAVCAGLVAGLIACGGPLEHSEQGEEARLARAQELAALKSSGSERAERRAYDGAPPVIPHEELAAECSSCHGERGIGIAGLGFSPPSPHGATAGMTAARCRQCHVPRLTERVFVASRFAGLAPNVGPERAPVPRQHELAPPVIPHRVFMRESCQACHAGPAAREEIRTTHPERENCQQCHVPVVSAVGEVFRLTSPVAS